MDKLSLLLDPVTNQIIQLLRGNGPMTAGELLEAEINVSRATLYRKIEKLVAEKIIDICDTKIVRGQTEKKYCIRNIVITEQSNNAERLETVTIGLMNMLSQYINYFDNEDADVERDKLFMMNYSIALSDEDYSMLINDIVSLLDRYQAKSSKETKLRSLHLMSVPTENFKG